MTNVTIGMDLGDKNHEVCVSDQEGHRERKINIEDPDASGINCMGR